MMIVIRYGTLEYLHICQMNAQMHAIFPNQNKYITPSILAVPAQQVQTHFFHSSPVTSRALVFPSISPLCCLTWWRNSPSAFGCRLREFSGQEGGQGLVTFVEQQMFGEDLEWKQHVVRRLESVFEDYWSWVDPLKGVHSLAGLVG